MATEPHQTERRRSSFTVSRFGPQFVYLEKGGKGVWTSGSPSSAAAEDRSSFVPHFCRGKGEGLRGDVPHLGGSQARMGKPMSIACQASWSWEGNRYSPTSTISPGQRGSLPQSDGKRLRGLHTGSVCQSASTFLSLKAAEGPSSKLCLLICLCLCPGLSASVFFCNEKIFNFDKMHIT